MPISSFSKNCTKPFATIALVYSFFVQKTSDFVKFDEILCVFLRIFLYVLSNFIHFLYISGLGHNIDRTILQFGK